MANTVKKNQHYLPKFYLRNFSHQSDNKHIGLYNLNKKHFHSTAQLRHQGSRAFYYGTDGKIEDALSQLEDRFARLLKTIIQSRHLPRPNTIEQFDLLCFVAVTDLRNPAEIEKIPNAWEEAEKKMKEVFPNSNYEELPEISQQKAMGLSFSSIKNCAEIMSDLSYKLLINETNRPFISSDFPVVKYNQYQESQKTLMPKCGYASLGMQFFIPLSPQLLLVLYDSSVYKIGNKRDCYLIVDNDDDINQLNILQFINCIENVYFNGQVDINYLSYLHQRASRFPKSNVPFSHGNQPETKINESGEKMESSVITVSTTDCDIKLHVHGIRVHSGAKGKPFDRTRVLIRPKVELILERQKQDRISHTNN